MREIRTCAGLILACALLVSGCGTPTDAKLNEVLPSDTNLATIGRLYSQAQQQLGRPPGNAADLKPFIATQGELDALLVSPNDHEPYVIVWGTNLLSTPNPSIVVAYEQTGAKGLRHVLTPTGTRIMDEAELAKAEFPAGHKPAGR
jgi:hypothetical protein